MSKRDGWERQIGTVEIDNGKGKTYRNMVRFIRPCATCGEAFEIHVTESCADGAAHNSSFGLRNCAKHRMKMTPSGDGSEIERLRMANSIMKQELDYLYASERELKARLAKYESTTAFNPKESLARELARNGKPKVPWE
jgi:hypothetical protein